MITKPEILCGNQGYPRFSTRTSALQVMADPLFEKR